MLENSKPIDSSEAKKQINEGPPSKSARRFRKLINNFLESPNDQEPKITKAPCSTANLLGLNRQACEPKGFELQRKLKTEIACRKPADKHFLAPSKNPQNLKISNFIANNNLSNISKMNAFFAYSPNTPRLNQSANNLRKLINGIQRETLKNQLVAHTKKSCLFDRKLTPEPNRKVQEASRNLTPNRSSKGFRNVLPHQLFLKKEDNKMKSLACLKPADGLTEQPNKLPDIRKFELLFQSIAQLLTDKRIELKEKDDSNRILFPGAKTPRTLSKPLAKTNGGNEGKAKLQSLENLRVKSSNQPQVLEIFKVVTKIREVRKQTEQILPACKEYLANLIKLDLNFYEKITEDRNRQDSLRKAIILERIVILIVLSFSLRNSFASDDNEKIMNLINKIHENLTIILKELFKTSRESKQGLAEFIGDSSLSVTPGLDSLDQNNEYLIKEIKSCCSEKVQSNTTISLIINNLDIFSVFDASHSILQSFEKIIALQENPQNPPMKDPSLSLPLPLAKAPYLPAMSPGKEYTLVLDLDETLVHYQELKNNTGQFLIRPFVDPFLKDMSRFYELVVFTAATQDYADWILDVIDPKRFISHRLYRDHAQSKGTHFLKDLSKLGRDLAKTIIIDNLAENFELQPENGIFIQSWYGEPNDKALKELSPLLREIVQQKSEDVRTALSSFRDQLMRKIRQGITEPHKNLNLTFI